MIPSVTAFFDEPTGTVSYLVADPVGRRAALVDPLLDYDVRRGRVATASADAMLQAAAQQRLAVDYVLETHLHADHLSAADHIRRRTAAKVVAGAAIRVAQRAFSPLFGACDLQPGAGFDRLVTDGQRLALGGLEIAVMETPGHTPTCVTYVVGDAAFVGDTLFMPDGGTARADFPGGDAATLYRSIRRILDLPARTRIYVAHDYPSGRPAQCEATVADHRARNIHVRDGLSEADFVALRTTRDASLPPPALMAQALQVNIRAGALPPPSRGGRVFLKLPVELVA